MERTIDNVTTQNLDMALRMCNIQIDEKILGRIIDIVELLEEKGNSTSMRDISKLRALWTEDKSRD